MPHHTHPTAQQHSTATQHSNTAQPFTSVCLEFLTTLTFRALHGNHIVSIPFESIVKKKRPERFRPQMSSPDILPPPPHDMQFACLSHIRDSFVFSIFFVSPGHLGTIQNLIPGWMTIVKLLKQVKNWQCPSRDPWSNCLINSREDDKGQSYYYSGRQKDNSKTICRRAGYSVFVKDTTLFQKAHSFPQRPLV